MAIFQIDFAQLRFVIRENVRSTKVWPERNSILLFFFPFSNRSEGFVINPVTLNELQLFFWFTNRASV
jgi:hypothetical protein